MTRTALWLSAGLLLAAAPATAQDLPTALAEAMALAPGVAAADGGVDEANARIDEARAARGPSARIEGSVGIGRIDPGGFFGLTADNVTPRAVQVVGEMPLYAGGRISAAVAQAQGGAMAAQAQRHLTRQQLQVEVVAAYAELLTARQLLDSYSRLVSSLDEIVRGAQLRFQVGDAASTEVAQARARRAEGLAGRVGAEGRLIAAQSRLTQLVGHPLTPLAPLGALPMLPATLDEAIDLARSDNAMRAQAAAGVTIAQAGVRAARASNAPTVGAFAEGAYVRDQFFPAYQANSVTVGVRARWTFFDSGASGARVRQAQAALGGAEARARDTDDRVTQAVIEAWQGVATARQMVDASRDGVAAAAEALRGTRLEVQVGAKPQLAALDAEREAIAATARLAEAEGQLHVAAYRLRAITGME